jgi:hypothetical protein
MERRLVPLAVAALVGCHDAPTAPLTSDQAARVIGVGSPYLSARVSATGFLERHIEYDWTVRKFVSEIMDDHMVAEGSTSHTEILPGQVKWIAYYIDPARHIASDRLRSGVRGDVCIKNASERTSPGLKVFLQLQSSSDDAWTVVPNTATTVATGVQVSAGATRCFSYEISHAMQPGVTYRVIGGAVASVHAISYVTAAFVAPEQVITVEIDREAFARDEVYQACARTLGSKFRCESIFGLPYTWHFTETSDGRWEHFPPGDYYTYYVLDIGNDGVCGKTVTYKNVANLWESGPTPPGGERHDAEATVTITTGECRGGHGCTKTLGYWKNHAGGTKKTDAVSPLLPLWLGTADGEKSVQVTTAEQAVEILAKREDASNGINKLYAQLLAAKLNIRRGADDSIVARLIAAADLFLARMSGSQWAALQANDRRSVLNWAEFLDDFNNGTVGPGHCDDEDDDEEDTP